MVGGTSGRGHGEPALSLAEWLVLCLVCEEPRHGFAIARPASHNRDVRSELLAKLALIDRAGGSPGKLIDAQRDQLMPVARALHEQLGTASGFDRTLVLWRCETVSATLGFLGRKRAGRTRMPARHRGSSPPPPAGSANDFECAGC